MNEAKMSKNITLSRRITLGIWADEGGRAHIQDEEMLKAFKLEDNPRNRQAVREVIEETARQLGIKLTP